MMAYLTDEAQLGALIAHKRLCPVLVRYRGTTDGRFTAPAQDVPDLVAMLKVTGRYVRDMSIALPGQRGRHMLAGAMTRS